jgi:hypothetical protein
VKHLCIKKATGLGISTFFLRLMAWLCLYNDDYRDSQMAIVTGPNIELAVKLIKRMKAMFAEKLGVTFDTKETVLELNGCSIEAYPSNHIDAFRSLTNPKFILLDEADYHRKNEQEDVRAVSERYIAKSDPFIVMVSTPNAPGGLFEKDREGTIRVIYAEEYDRPDFSEMIQEVWDLRRKCGHVTNIYCDAAIPEVVQALKKEFEERFNEQYIREQFAFCRKYNLHIEDRMFIVPVPFSVEAAKSLQHAKWLLDEREEDSSSLIQIDRERFHKLVTALRTAVANEYKLDKEVTVYNDILDPFRLSNIL